MKSGTNLFRKFEEFEKAVLAKGWQPGTSGFSSFANKNSNGYKLFGTKSGKTSAMVANTTCAKCGSAVIKKTGKRKDESTWKGVFCSIGYESHKI